MTTTDLAAVVLWIGVTTYAIFGGADFGAGFWDAVAGRGIDGPRARELISAAIGPVWEANHTWLIFDLVILWTAFPAAFAAVMSTLFIPFSLAAVGIVLRGATFAFRPVVSGARGRRTTSAIFAASSVVTPFFLGAAAGGIAGGRVAPDPGRVDLIGSWLNPTSLLVGVMAVAVCAYVAAVFLVADARRLGMDDLASAFLRRATAVAIVLGALSVIGIGVLAIDAPELARELTTRGWPLIVAGGALGVGALVALRMRAPRGTRPLAVGAVVAVLWGWGVAQYPDILPGTLTLAAAAAPAGSVGSLLIVFVIAAVLIAPSLGLLFWLTQQGRLQGHDSARDGGATTHGGRE
ncbi:MAG: cytochrome bd ubiquinol oxidase subunit [Chloroflexota bacterium]|jgi:cytochrome d ubiquinol oxidase subunit II|nr:cytochrome bd ubiquinol oxidase subunit [Chloroflexota bacterium]